MRMSRAVAMTAVVLSMPGAWALAAGAQAAPQAPAAPAQPPATTGQPGQVAGQVPPAAAPPAPMARTFSAPAGLLFNSVRADRVGDFEKVLAYLQAALSTSTNPTVQAQAKGWRIYKATEPGPNSTVLYVFSFTPAVSGADYSLGRILADAYPDAAQLQEIWRLYQGAVTSGGSLLNLTPVAVVPPPPLTVPGATPPAGTPPAGTPPAGTPPPSVPAAPPVAEPPAGQSPAPQPPPPNPLDSSPLGRR